MTDLIIALCLIPASWALALVLVRQVPVDAWWSLPLCLLIGCSGPIAGLLLVGA